MNSFFILKLFTAYLLDGQHCFCDTAFSAIFIVERYFCQTGQAHSTEVRLMTLLAIKFIVLKKWELLTTISKKHIIFIQLLIPTHARFHWLKFIKNI